MIVFPLGGLRNLVCLVVLQVLTQERVLFPYCFHGIFTDTGRSIDDAEVVLGTIYSGDVLDDHVNRLARHQYRWTGRGPRPA